MRGKGQSCGMWELKARSLAGLIHIHRSIPLAIRTVNSTPGPIHRDSAEMYLLAGRTGDEEVGKP